MRHLMVLALSLCLFVPTLAAEGPTLVPRGVAKKPLPELMRQLETLRAQKRTQSLQPISDVVLEGAEPAFIFAVVGTAGAFRTEAVLVNRRNQPQRVFAYYWPIGAGASNCNRGGLEYTMDAKAKYLFTDFVPELFPGQSGFGSVIIIGVDSFGGPDANAAIDGNARIWSVATGGGTASQNFPSMSVGVPPGEQSAFGLRSDEFYRTNWGIFNYDSVARTFDIAFDGFRAEAQIAESIPPCSLIQKPVTGGPYGSLEIVFAPRDGRGLYYAYGSSVDNTSQDAWSVPARK